MPDGLTAPAAWQIAVEMCRQAALAGQTAPRNSEICAAIGKKSPSEGTEVLREAERLGIVIVTRANNSRVVTAADGSWSTARPAGQPNWQSAQKKRLSMARQRIRSVLSDAEKNARWAFVERRRAEGSTDRDIARELGLSMGGLRSFLATYVRGQASAATMRRCLGPECGKQFPSLWAGNRLCPTCRDTVGRMGCIAEGDTGKRAGSHRPRA